MPITKSNLIAPEENHATELPLPRMDTFSRMNSSIPTSVLKISDAAGYTQRQLTAKANFLLRNCVLMPRQRMMKPSRMSILLERAIQTRTTTSFLIHKTYIFDTLQSEIQPRFRNPHRVLLNETSHPDPFVFHTHPTRPPPPTRNIQFKNNQKKTCQ